MAKFTFRISREYTITESFDRDFEVGTVGEAQALADAEADESNMNCPDDCSEDESGNTESTDFIAELVQLIENPGELLNLGKYALKAERALVELGNPQAQVAPKDVAANLMEAAKNEPEEVEELDVEF